MADKYVKQSNIAIIRDWVKSKIPKKTSELQNDSGFLTAHQDISGKQDKLIAGSNITIADDGKTISATGGGGGEITADAIEDALGYTPADADDVSQLQEDITNKQDKISDLDTIRAGASAGAVALPKNPANWPTMTSAQQDTACAVLGAERQNGEWVLKGTMTDPAGVNVDLTGCTEIYILSNVTSTSNAVNLMTNCHRLSYKFISATGSTGQYGRWADSPTGGIDMVVGRTWNSFSFDYATGILNGDCWFDKKISDMTKFYFSNTTDITYCNVKIYAR